MYKEIGDIFKYQDVTLQVVESCSACKDCPLYLKDTKECNPIQHCCNNCYFYETFGHCGTMLCSHIERKDHKDVIFKNITYFFVHFINF